MSIVVLSPLLSSPSLSSLLRRLIPLRLRAPPLPPPPFLRYQQRQQLWILLRPRSVLLLLLLLPCCSADQVALSSPSVYPRFFFACAFFVPTLDSSSLGFSRARPYSSRPPPGFSVPSP
ncbi:hypothetical protein NL676_020782 [Syzygium grande]|nr:hypothetical protein NL676_020782 [Syzygium grande]